MEDLMEWEAATVWACMEWEAWAWVECTETRVICKTGPSWNE
jgi:hypothetical protein